jgi:hypothetical protein
MFAIRRRTVYSRRVRLSLLLFPYSSETMLFPPPFDRSQFHNLRIRRRRLQSERVARCIP